MTASPLPIEAVRMHLVANIDMALSFARARPDGPVKIALLNNLERARACAEKIE